MAKRYRGDSRLARVEPDPSPGHTLKLRVSPDNVHFLMAIMEGYSHLAFPAQVNPKEGKIILHTTPPHRFDLQAIVNHLAFAVEVE
ncbi:MAG TPA: DUF4911 domain-containing protein [Syntrophothermus lipocalidus]|uniref:DUF4911 domain-containing protein n=1 Tax=Syntrophothermus sp. TaxID=2736299 RepID=UPI0017DED9AD|nr:DUF4911 domain-containing protein [Syntrophothermus sp.]NSW83549.1 DUF4911 domain-containing protein [Syntrophothermus sp.]HHV77731.1 DUF4911 domain-containing protein [Syntrophothermus lipocalidus]HOV42768.1 DUF4911 domain-containing protein [Syntrophothermus lipocalidus]